MTKSSKNPSSKKRVEEQFSELKPLPHLKSQYETLNFYIKNLIENNLSDQVLITGPIGSGKTFLIKASLSVTKKDYRIFTYNGMIQKNALDSIKEILEPETTIDLIDSSFQDTADNDFKRCIVIIENVELFCLNNRQQFLYNLFQRSISNHGILIILVSNRPDVIELFEKRVRSRFTHNQITTNYPTTKEEVKETVEHFLRSDNMHQIEEKAEKITDAVVFSSYNLYSIRNMCYESEITNSEKKQKDSAITLSQKEKEILRIIKNLHENQIEMNFETIYDKHYKAKASQDFCRQIPTQNNTKDNRMEIKHYFEKLKKKGIIEYLNKPRKNVDLDYAQCIYNHHLEITE